MLLKIATFTITVTAASSLLAADRFLQFPLDCELGETCFVQQYVDQDPSTAAQDFTCGPLSYDTHNGTDFRVTDLTDMEAGVDVLAAAAGSVRAVRDGVQDAFLTDEIRASLSGRGCGNGVLVQHKDGWQTQYCHLKMGSISVEVGQEIKAGTTLGKLGLSGFTEFPHLEFIVRHEGKIIDPFARNQKPQTAPKCGVQNKDEQLWISAIPYQAGSLMKVGFLDRLPRFEDVKAGTAASATLNTSSKALVLWGYMFGAQKNDILRFNITGPSGRVVFEHEMTLEKTQAELYRAAGRPLRAQAWTPGQYHGYVEVWRDDMLISTLDESILIE